MEQVAAGLLGPLVSSLFGSDQPKTPEARVAPKPDDEAARRAKARTMQRDYATTGRAGTSLTSDNSTLG